MDEGKRIQAKIRQHSCITNLLSKKQAKCEKLRVKLEKNQKEQTALVSTWNSLLKELKVVGSMSPASKQVQEYLCQTELTSASQASGTDTQRALTLPVTELEPQSVVAMIVEAAKQAEHLELYNDILADMYAEASAESIAITAELDDLKVKKRQMEEEIQRLSRSVEDLKQLQAHHPDELNIESQQRRQLSWMVSSSHDSDNASIDMTSDDPVQLREKIKELNERIATLMNHNDKWNTICESMKKEIEEAKRQLEETCRASSADRETQHEGKSDSSLADWTSRIRLHVQFLESRIVTLENSLETKDYRDIDIERIQIADRDSKLAMELQLEEYKKEIEESNLALNREKSNTKSLQFQLDTLYKELEAARKGQEELVLKNKELQERLKKVSGDKTLLERHLNRSPTSCGVEARSGSMYDCQKTPLFEESTTNPRRRLEEDGK